MLAARTAVLLALAAFASLAVACSAAPDTKKPLPVCDAKDPECPGVPASSANKTHSDIPTDPVKAPDPVDPAPAASPEPPVEHAEAGVDAAPVVGVSCQGLAACCTQLGDAGYDTTTCKSVLSTNNEAACTTQHASYKSFGDCT